jgi:2-polyprenyl-3-methyl-5-hydroxy-6-metoxy-1,4-benzoquinol methylase
MGINVDKNSGDNRPGNYFDLTRGEMLKYIPNNTRTLLDIGCGEGAFGYELKQRRITEVWGIEVVSQIAEKARERIDRVIVGDCEIDDIDLPTNFFDCIVFNDILEHVRDPWSVLKKLKQCLSKDGCVVASIPNVRYYTNLKALLLRKEWKYKSCGILDYGHLRFFTEKSILSMFDECGYSVTKIEGINPLKLSWKLSLVNKIGRDFLGDTKFLQFACVAKVKI